MKRGQVSFEYLIVIGFAMLIIVPVIVLAFSSFTQFQQVLIVKQAEKAATTLVSESESVFYLGPPSKRTFDIFIPPQVSDVFFLSDAVVFRMNLGGHYEDVIIFTDIGFSGVVPTSQGTHQVTTETNGEFIIIS